MALFPKIAAGALTLMIGIPLVAAKIYPDDFLIPGQTIGSDVVTNAASSSSSSSFSSDAASASDEQPIFFPSDIPDGQLTRGQFIDSLGSRLYNSSAQDTCFSDLVSQLKANYTLLFNDMSITQPLALSVCVMMNNGLVRGSSVNLHPNQHVTVAEAAAVFSRLSTAIRNPNGNEPWYQRYMETMRSLDPHFTLQPGAILTGEELRDMFCVLKRTTPQLDPVGEFNGC